MCREHQLGFIAHSPLAGGFLAQRPVSEREVLNLDRNWQAERFGNNIGDAVLKVLAEIADKRLATPAQIAITSMLRNAQVSSAVISSPGARELRELIGAADIHLTPKETGALANVTTVHDYRMELHQV